MPHSISKCIFVVHYVPQSPHKIISRHKRNALLVRMEISKCAASLCLCFVCALSSGRGASVPFRYLWNVAALSMMFTNTQSSPQAPSGHWTASIEESSHMTWTFTWSMHANLLLTISDVQEMSMWPAKDVSVTHILRMTFYLSLTQLLSIHTWGPGMSHQTYHKLPTKY